MIRLLSFYVLLLISCICNGQTLKHTDLSPNFAFETSVKRIRTKHAFDSCLVRIKIVDMRNDSLLQTIKFQSNFLFDFSYSHLDSCRSYITCKKQNSDAPDNDFGDIVVADFNFDGKEDFAFKTEEGGNGGPLYSFYIQDANGAFKKDCFLTDKMVYFPSEINSVKKVLVTIVHANAMGVNFNTYRLDTTKNIWKYISQEFVGVNAK